MPYRLGWKLQLAQLQSEKLNADSVSCSGFWRAPELAITNLSVVLGGGQLDASARLNVATRKLTFTNSSCFDVHAIASLLTEKTRARLAEISWAQLPLVRAGGALVLPEWAKRQPDWRGEVQQTVRLSGDLAVTNGIFQGVAFDLARTHFSYANLVWELPDFVLAQERTRLEISGSENDTTKDYHWHICGLFDPESARPYLTASNAVRAFQIVTFTEPLALDVQVRGRLYDYDVIASERPAGIDEFCCARRGVWRCDGGGELHEPRAGGIDPADTYRRADGDGGQGDAGFQPADDLFHERLQLCRPAADGARHRAENGAEGGAVSFRAAAHGADQRPASITRHKQRERRGGCGLAVRHHQGRAV